MLPIDKDKVVSCCSNDPAEESQSASLVRAHAQQDPPCNIGTGQTEPITDHRLLFSEPLPHVEWLHERITPEVPNGQELRWSSWRSEHLPHHGVAQGRGVAEGELGFGIAVGSGSGHAVRVLKRGFSFESYAAAAAAA